MVPVTLRSRLFPPATFTPGIGTGGEGQGTVGRIVAAVVQPEVGAGPLIYAPGGRPGENEWMLWWGLAAVAAAWAVSRLLRR